MPKEPHKWWSTALTIGVIALGLLVLGAIIYHFQLKSEVEHYRAQLKAKGAWKEISQLRPPPIVFDKDGSATFVRGVSSIKNRSALNDNPPLAMHIVAPGKAMVGASQSQICGDLKTNTWEEAQTIIDREKEALDLLTQVIERPQFDFHIAYEHGFADEALLRNAHIPDARPAALLLARAAMIDLHQGNASAAVKKTRAALAITSAMENQRLVFSEMVRISTAAIAQPLSWEILQSGKASDADLAALQKDWEQLDFLRGYQQAFEMECAMKSVTLEQLRNGDINLQKTLTAEMRARGGSQGDDEIIPSIKEAEVSGQIFFWRYWQSYPYELRALKGEDVLKQALLFTQTNGSFGMALKQQSQLEISAVEAGDRGVISSIFSIYPSRYINRVMLAEAIQRMTIAAIALKRYELAHGKYPTTLTDLVPDYVQSVPLDPVDANPLSYKLNPDGTFLLYSLGENLVDDGGNPKALKTNRALSWQQGLDWVWPQPATSEEIREWQNSKNKRR